MIQLRQKVKRKVKKVKEKMKEFYLTVEQYERVVDLAKRTNKTTDELVDELERWSECYDTVDEILKDYEEVNA